MAKKKASKIISKKHLARQEREARQTRTIVGVSIGIVALVILLIAYGLLSDTLFLRWRPAVTVNGETLSLQEFQVRVRATRQSYVNQYMYYTQLYAMFGMDPSQDSSLTSIQTQLDSPSTIGSSVIDNMVNELLIRQYAKKNNITVSADELQTAVENGLGYGANGTPTPTSTSTSVVYPTLDATQFAMITPTRTPTVAPTSTTQPTATSDPNATAAPTGTPTLVPSLTPTVTPFTYQGFLDTYKNNLKTYAPDGMSEEQFRRIYYEDKLYEDKVKAVLTKNVARTQDEVWARHILVADEKLANAIYNQLQAGGNFATLASQYSIDTSNKDTGGDLGWFPKGQMVAEFETAIWDLPVGTLTKPVKTTYGYHIIEILGHEKDRPLSDTDYTNAVNTAFNTWLQDQRAGSTVVINDKWTQYTPTSPTIAEAQDKQNATQTAYVGTYFAQATQTGAVITPTPK
jgi:peptidyl-prolyl cis-trans isomerase D